MGALIHPSLITLLCRMVEVTMSNFEEQSPHKLLVPLPKKNNFLPQDLDDSIEEREEEEEG